MSRRSIISIPITLSATLSAASQPGAAHTGGLVDLPAPGLRLATLPHTVALPLVPPQANLVRHVATSCPGLNGCCACYEVSGGDVLFANEEWSAHLRHLATDVVTRLGYPEVSLEIFLRALVLQGEGEVCARHLEGNREGEGVATLVVQLPSCYVGGEVLVGEEGRREVYPEDVRKRLVEFRSGYLAFYSDVDRVLRPVEGGCRLMLVYSLNWDVSEGSRLGAGRRVKDVAAELRHVAGMYPNGAWMMGMDVGPHVSESELERDRVGVLSCQKRRAMEAIREAACVAGMGSVEMRLCLLTRLDVEKWPSGAESGEGREEEVEKGLVDRGCPELVLAIEVDAGAALDDVPLDFFVGEGCDLKFTQKEVKRAEPDEDSDAVYRTVSKTCVAVLMWPTAKTRERRFLTEKGMDFVMENYAPRSAHELVQRFLPCLEAREASEASSWEDVEFLISYSLERREWEPAVALLSFATRMRVMPYIDVKMREALTTFGWNRVAYLVHQYLAPAELEKVECMAGHIRSADAMVDAIPSNVLLDYLEKVSAFVVHRKGRLAHDNVPENCNSEQCELWTCLFRTLCRAECKCTAPEAHERVEEVAGRFATTIQLMNYNDLSNVFEALNMSEQHFISRYMVAVKATLHHHVGAGILTHMRGEVNELIARCRSVEAVSRSGVFMEMWPALAEKSHVLLFVREFTAKAEKLFHSLVRVIAEVDDTDVAEVEEMLVQFPLDHMLRHIQDKLMDVIGCAKSQIRKRELMSKIIALEKKTLVEPENVSVMYRYPGGFSSGILEVENFMTGPRMKINVGRFKSTADAREALSKFEHRLPPGMFCCVSGHKPHVCIHLTKPHAEMRARWLEYNSDVLTLRKLRLEMKSMDGRDQKAAYGGAWNESSQKKGVGSSLDSAVEIWRSVDLARS